MSLSYLPSSSLDVPLALLCRFPRFFREILDRPATSSSRKPRADRGPAQEFIGSTGAFVNYRFTSSPLLNPPFLPRRPFILISVDSMHAWKSTIARRRYVMQFFVGNIDRGRAGRTKTKRAPRTELRRGNGGGRLARMPGLVRAGVPSRFSSFSAAHFPPWKIFLAPRHTPTANGGPHIFAASEKRGPRLGARRCRRTRSATPPRDCSDRSGVRPLLRIRAK